MPLMNVILMMALSWDRIPSWSKSKSHEISVSSLFLCTILIFLFLCNSPNLGHNKFAPEVIDYLRTVSLQLEETSHKEYLRRGMADLAWAWSTIANDTTRM